MPPKYICIADNFYSSYKEEALGHLDTFPSHEIVEISRDENGEIKSRLIKITEEKNLGA